MNYIVETKHLKKYYQMGDTTVKALDGIDFCVKDQEFIAIIGKSGSGKSTLLHMLGGLDTPTEGEVLIEGKSILKLKKEQLAIFRRRKIGFIFQNYNLVPDLNVYENVILPVELDGRKVDTEYVNGILKLLRISEKKDMLPGTLSGGQQQRVALVRSLITKPKVLLLDEPLSNLDAKLRVKMREEIREIQKKYEITMVFVTHDQEEAMVLGDKIAIMDQGKLIQIGRPEEVYLHPQNDFARDFLGISNQFTDMRGNHICCRPEELEFVDNGTVKGTVK